MIVGRQFYNIQCDHCGKLLDEETWWGEKDLVEGLILDESGWIECDGRHYCDGCWSRDDDDNIVTKDGRKWDDDTHKEMQQTNFALYINELCEYYRKNRTLKGKGEIRKRYKVSDISVQQFFVCELHKAVGYVPQDFCNRVYAFVLDTTKAVPAPKYESI